MEVERDTLGKTKVGGWFSACEVKKSRKAAQLIGLSAKDSSPIDKTTWEGLETERQGIEVSLPSVLLIPFWQYGSEKTF